MSLSHSAPPPAVFQPSDGLRALAQPRNVGARVPSERPIPTNAWWGNLLAWDARAQPESDAVFAGPYAHRVLRDGLSSSYLHQYRSDGPTNDNGAVRFYFYPPALKNWVFSAAELAGAGAGAQLAIEDWDDLGVHLELRAGDHAALATYLTLGSAFTTVRYSHLRPLLRSEHVLLTVNGAPSHPGARFRGTQFIVTLNNGHTWVLYAFPGQYAGDIELEVTPEGTGLVAAAQFSGVVQAAYVSSTTPPPGIAHWQADTGAILSLYQAAAGIYPVGMMVSHRGSEEFSYQWRLARATASPVAHKFVHFALTHLKEMIDERSAQRCDQLVLFAHTRGPMFAYAVPVGPESPTATARWDFRVPRSTVSSVARGLAFYPERADLSRDIVERLKLASIVHDEIYGDWILPREGSYYFKGKLLQKWGTMCLVAKKLSETTNPDLAETAKVGIAKLQLLMMDFISNSSAYPLVYDTVYKGIISSEALVKHDVNVDFGNAVYNDHHYHYGYTVTAAAMTLYLSNDNWRKSAGAVKLRTFVDTLVRDVMCVDSGAQFFPRFRHFDWFQGHSYSHGVTPMADGKDEESTSEEVNFFYGLALYSRVTENTEMEQLATLMLNVYSRAVSTYFLMTDDNSIHPSTFRRNKVTGIFFDNKCDYATWFSPNKECIHGIQMLPVSPIMNAVRSPTFIREEWDQVLSKLDMVKNWQAHASGWTSILFSNFSVLDRECACGVLASCPMDDGLSRAWALYMAATR